MEKGSAPKVVVFPSAPAAEGPIELLEGRNLGNTILHAISRARRERRAVRILRNYTTSQGVGKTKPILFISPQGDLSEALAEPLRTKLGEFVVEQVLREGRVDGPAGRMLATHLSWRKEHDAHKQNPPQHKAA
jgi:hypothetical protein